MLRFIRFDNESTRAERTKTEWPTPIRDIWIMLNRNLEKAYESYECITIDEQLFSYRVHTKFTQYIPSKPAKYDIKVFWAYDASNSYPLQGQIYTRKPINGQIGKRTILKLVSLYEGYRKNITLNNFFTAIELAKVLKSWNMILIGAVRKNKRLLQRNMQPNKERPVSSTNCAYDRNATVCSYVSKKK